VCGLNKQQCALATNCYCCQAKGDKNKKLKFLFGGGYKKTRKGRNQIDEDTHEIITFLFMDL